VLPRDVTGSGSRLVLLHGFGQTRHCWAPLDALLAAGHEVMRVDLPGHGDARHLVAGLEDGADLVGETGGRAAYAGYSMGGRHALALALRHPDLVTALVMVGATPGLVEEAERIHRRRRDDALAAAIEAVGIDRFVTDWLAQPMFAGLSPAARFEDERRRNDPAALAESLRRAGPGSQPSLWDRLPELDVPVLLVVGEADEKYRAIAQRMAAALPRATVELVAGAGHAAHLEQPHRVAAAVDAFLSS
jgi:2-succinyl-6-hydroxy-2,4-cyclohexadiene-1-carboxylate synthase